LTPPPALKDDDPMKESIRGTLDAHCRAAEALAAMDLGPLGAAAVTLVETLRAGGIVLACGNGGSAADAQHFAAELVGRYRKERRPLRAVALTTDTSILTAV
jgi:D-sedoheptulose 7-phosphate isomerase